MEHHMALLFSCQLFSLFMFFYKKTADRDSANCFYQVI
ncbi:hypothetical protein CU024_0968 [Enterococcus faecium]|nr:hypothetical protein [Enterococcus faecium]MBL4990129.1 hypothetical protein [Enterococcus lactis]MBK4848065.1 hypothetical protein [Enterococcus faecium]MBK4870425.1 hypothetical protein [Enterococcus faecium]MBL4992719.1 hypothetical protein [Enterococcus lactis]